MREKEKKLIIEIFKKETNVEPNQYLLNGFDILFNKYKFDEDVYRESCIALSKKMDRLDTYNDIIKFFTGIYRNKFTEYSESSNTIKYIGGKDAKK